MKVSPPATSSRPTTVGTYAGRATMLTLRHDKLEDGTGWVADVEPGKVGPGRFDGAGSGGDHSRRARRAAARPRGARGGASRLRLEPRPLRMAAPALRLVSRPPRPRAQRLRVGPRPLGAARGPLRLARRRVAPAPLS